MRRKKEAMMRVIFAAAVAAAMFAAGCGGGGGGGGTAAVTLPTDNKVISKGVAPQAAESVVKISAMNYNSASNPMLGRAAGRAVKHIAADRKAIRAATRAADTITETQSGNTYTQTYTNEDDDGCIVNGSISFTATSDTTATYGGTLYYTSCPVGPATYTFTISEGAFSSVCTQASGNDCIAGTDSMSAKLAMSGASYTVSGSIAVTDSYTATTETISYAVSKTSADGETSSESCTITSGASSMSCTLTGKYSDATAFNLTFTFYNDDRIKVTGTETLTNSVAITYPTSSGINIAADGSGSASFSLNTGHSGSITLNSNGSGSGTLKDSSNSNVATFSWGASATTMSVTYSDNTTETLDIS